jgi:branched-chain amino acid transport system ATP-binding protein
MDNGNSLEIKDLYVGYYKDLNILQGVSLSAALGKITTILGANGVGKSTLLKAIYGFLKPNGGEVVYKGENIVGTPTHKIIDLGISYIPQQTGIFKWMSVEENVRLGGWTFRNDKSRVRSKVEENYERFPDLVEKRKEQAGNLSGGKCWWTCAMLRDSRSCLWIRRSDRHSRSRITSTFWSSVTTNSMGRQMNLPT